MTHNNSGQKTKYLFFVKTLQKINSHESSTKSELRKSKIILRNLEHDCHQKISQECNCAHDTAKCWRERAFEFNNAFEERLEFIKK